MTSTTIRLSEIERDERVAHIQSRFGASLRAERGYAELPEDRRSELDLVLSSVESMRFETREQFERVARSLLTAVAPNLDAYVGIAVDGAAREIASDKGVLVLYTGGTIGSAPRDADDPDSPQIVKPWRDLRRAAPQLGLLGYPVDAISLVDPLDSCNVGPEHWAKMCDVVADHIDEYMGFVILHGTDTMVYTASALSFMLGSLTKPVVLTGAQVAGIVNPRNDAHQNMITAVMLANPLAHGLPNIPEVVVAFGNIVTRGNRARKMDVIGYQGFRSPNLPPLAQVGEVIEVDRSRLRETPVFRLDARSTLETNVIMLEVFPGIQTSGIVKNVLADERLKGVVLKSYGAGNIPTDPEFLDLFVTFVEAGGIVLNVTSVPEGEVVMGLYETSQLLIDRGIIGGFDITPEAALCKLMWVLGNEPDRDQVRSLMQRSIAGEQSLSLATTELRGDATEVTSASGVVVQAERINSVTDGARIRRVLLRFRGTVLTPAPGRENLRIRLTAPDTQEVFGEYRRNRPEAKPAESGAAVGESLVFDLTPWRDLFVAEEGSGELGSPYRLKKPVGFQVEVVDDGSSIGWNGVELNVFYAD